MAIHGNVISIRLARQATRPAPRRSVWSALKAMLRAHRTRRLLAEMDDRMLADIGVDRGQAHMEASRAPWDLGPHR